ncbi:MAG: carboxypeptidase regulatory-like domain-containing protein [Clostridia bacterium]|nr:carboxypeptidase regulatory-like domain-containing protein [Clostridia bacterium]
MMKSLKKIDGLPRKTLAVLLSVLLVFSALSIGVTAKTTLYGESFSAKTTLLGSWNSSANNGVWRAEYATYNTGGVWYPMQVVSDEQGSFSSTGMHANQPAAFLNDDGIILLANQWGNTTSWWDKAAVSFVCPEDGLYRLSCAQIKAGNSEAFIPATGNEGHLFVSKNGVKIWPTDADFAVVTQNNPPNFEPFDIELAAGDVIRFEGYGVAAGGEDLTNNGSWQNHIFVDPSITRIYAKDVEMSYVLAESDNGVTAFRSIWNENSASPSDLVWDNYNWRAEYTNANLSEWVSMKMTGTEGSFSFNGTHESQPASYVYNNSIILLANQWGGGGWWDKSGVAYVCKEAGNYLLTCDQIRAALSNSFAVANGNEGRLSLTKNGVKIWPVDADYATITATSAPAFEPMQIPLEAGDILRFEGYGATVGSTDMSNGGNWENHIAITPAIAKIIDVSYKTPDVQKLSVTAYKDLFAAWADSASATLNWDNYQWYAQYQTSNTGNWVNMVRATDQYGTVGFGYSASANSQPCLNVADNGVYLSANQWGSGAGWWDKSGIAFTAPKSGIYYLTCSEIKPYRETDLVSEHEGRVVLTKNGQKIWPQNADFASVTQNSTPTFNPMTIELNQGDVLRFETTSALIGATELDNGGNYFNNAIYLAPEINALLATVYSDNSTSLIGQGDVDLIANAVPEVACFRNDEMISTPAYGMNAPQNMTDRDCNTVSVSEFNMGNGNGGADADAYQTLTYEFGGEAVVKQLQVLHNADSGLYTAKYSLYIGDDMATLFDKENLIYSYDNETNPTRNQTFNISGYLKGYCFGIKIEKSNVAPSDNNWYASFAEIGASGYVLNDIDGDNQVIANDLVALRAGLLSGIPYKDRFDVSEDGAFNIKDLVRLKKNFDEMSKGINPVVSLSAKPTKPFADPETFSTAGYAAPAWMRDIERYTEASYADGFTTQADIDEWSPYFDLFLGGWSNNIDTFKSAGKKIGSYFDPYHVTNRTDLAVKSPDGTYAISDYPSDDPLYIVCHHSDLVLDWAKNYVKKCLDFGAQGMFLDDIRAAYWANPSRYNEGYGETCVSNDHVHTGSGVNSHALVDGTVKELYKLIKQRDQNNYVILNGGDYTAMRNDEELSYAHVIRYGDAAMSENYIYGSDGARWLSPEYMITYGKRFYNEGINQGKAHFVLCYSYDQMVSTTQILAAAKNTLAFTRLYDFAWSDYNVLRKTALSSQVIKELYSAKTGAAGVLGTYFGRVTDAASGAPIAGVTVQSGTVSVTTDANGYFCITPPVNNYSVTLTKSGYADATGTLCGYQNIFEMTKSSGTIYYVSNTGNNKNNGLSADHPFKSLNYADANNLLQPGDTVVVSAGTYNLPNQTTYRSNGTAQKPITYVADGEVTLRLKKGNGIGLILNGSNTVFDGFTVEGSSTGVAGLMKIAGSGIEVRNCTFRDSAYFNLSNRIASAAAVEITGANAFLHHNIFGQDLFVDAALVVNAAGARVLNNTFDGSDCLGGHGALAVNFGANSANVQVQNNIVHNYTDLYNGYYFALGDFGNNVYANIANGAGNAVRSTDLTATDVRFMNPSNGDYALKCDSVAVNAGANVGFAWRGEATDIGAVESKFSNLNYDAVDSASGITYRTFADAVVAVNRSESASNSVTISTGRPGVVLKELAGANQWTADANGNVLLTVAPGASLILFAK